MRSLFFLLLFSVPLLGKEPAWQYAKVISQNIGSRDSGAAAVPIGGIVAVVPLSERWNVVIVEDRFYRMEWHELGSSFLTLIVNDEVRFYRDKDDRCVVLDSKGKKHKFAIMHIEKIGEELRIGPE